MNTGLRKRWIAAVGLGVAMVCLSVGASADRIRHVRVRGDDIAVVRTAVGVATLLQLPDKPSSVVVGDQSAFKIEYLDQALAIKPLHGGAKSNLYVYTDWRRFTVQLVTGTAAAADYVVYLDAPKATPARASALGRAATVRWKPLGRSIQQDGWKWTVSALGKGQAGTQVGELRSIRFKISSNRVASLSPEWIWVFQGGSARPIQALTLSGTQLRPGEPVSGEIHLRRSDLVPGQGLRAEIRRPGKKTMALTIPREDRWT